MRAPTSFAAVLDVAGVGVATPQSSFDAEIPVVDLPQEVSDLDAELEFENSLISITATLLSEFMSTAISGATIDDISESAVTAMFVKCFDVTSFPDALRSTCSAQVLTFSAPSQCGAAA